DGVRPHGLHQLVLGEQPSGIRREDGEKVERLRCQRHGLAALQQQTLLRDEGHGAEPETRRRAVHERIMGRPGPGRKGSGGPTTFKANSKRIQSSFQRRDARPPPRFSRMRNHATPATTTAAPVHRSRFYVGVAVAVLLLCAAGFGPSLIVQSRRTAPITPLLMAHGFVTGGWLILFLAQAALVAFRRTTLHRRVG